MRQLDAWVAEHVMGIDVYWVRDQPYRTDTASPLVSYSTDMNAAMEVLDILDLHPAMYQWESDRGLMWGVDLGKYTGEHQKLPVAICLAALRAVGNE